MDRPLGSMEGPMVRIAVPALVLACLVSACDGNTDVALESVPLVVAAGSVGLDPEPEDRLSATVDLDRVGLDRVSNAYDVTTPADEPFLIDVVTRNDSNTGPVRISVAHVRDADA